MRNERTFSQSIDDVPDRNENDIAIYFFTTHEYVFLNVPSNIYFFNAKYNILFENKLVCIVVSEIFFKM